MLVEKALYHIGHEPLSNMKKTFKERKYKRVVEFINKHAKDQEIESYDMFKGTADKGGVLYLMQINFKDMEEVLNVTIKESEMRVSL